MYKVFAKKSGQTICIYNDSYMSEETTILNPKLELSENNAGQFTAKIIPSNVGYDFIERLNTEIIVKKNDVEIWVGRVLNLKEDFQKNRSITCEGDLAYLNDTIQPQKEYLVSTPSQFLTTVIGIHNQKVSQYDSSKAFTIGSITVEDPSGFNYNFTNYESTLKAISEKLIKTFGGYLKVRRENGVRYIDYLTESDRERSTQEIIFGKNLLDFTKSLESTDFCSVLTPLGARIRDEYYYENVEHDTNDIDAYTTIESVNSGLPYIVNQSAVNAFGWIEKTITYNDIDDPEELKLMAEDYLSNIQYDNVVLEINAVDLGYLGADCDAINISDNIRVISKPHGLDRYFPVKKMSIALDNPSSTTISLGSNEKVSMSYKSVSNNNSVSSQLDSIPGAGSILYQAKLNADTLINAFSTGYITITKTNNGSNELYISDRKISDGYDPNNPMADATRYWRWNLNGLAYYNRNDISNENPTGLKTAITMDGSIVADFIKTGTLTADLIKAGTLTSLNGKFSLNMQTGEVIMKAASLNGGLVGTYKDEDLGSVCRRKSSVLRDGYMVLLSSRIPYVGAESVSYTESGTMIEDGGIHHYGYFSIDTLDTARGSLNGGNERIWLDSDNRYIGLRADTIRIEAGSMYIQGKHSYSGETCADGYLRTDDGHYLRSANGYTLFTVNGILCEYRG